MEPKDDPELMEEDTEERAVRSLGLFDSLVYLANNIIGPGLVVLPCVWQEAGWLVTSVMLLAVMLLSALSAAALVEVHQRTVASQDASSAGEFYHLAHKVFAPKVNPATA